LKIKMSIKMDVTRLIVNEKIYESERFSLEELNRDIKIQGGGKKIAPGITVQDYLENLQEKGLIKYNPSEKMYVVVSNFLNNPN